jgi:hypothetical protein
LYGTTFLNYTVSLPLFPKEEEIKKIHGGQKSGSISATIYLQ